MAELKEISLVTGATGFIGAAVARRLLAAGHQVRVLHRPASDLANLQGLDVEKVTGDLHDAASLSAACRGATALFHVAADYRLWSRQPERMMRTNIDGTRNIMRAALEARLGRIIYTSSVATLGARSDGKAVDEAAPVSLSDMIGPYKRSKFLAEEEVRRMIADDGLAAVIVNPSAPMGPRDIKPTPTGRMVVEAAKGRMPAYLDTGLNVVHVDDVAEGHLLAFERGEVGERYILGGDNLTLKEILDGIAAAAGRRGPRFRVRHGMILPIAWLAELWTRATGGTEPFATVDGVRMAKKKMYFSSEKAKVRLGYAPRPAADAFRDAVDWYRQAGYLT